MFVQFCPGIGWGSEGAAPGYSPLMGDGIRFLVKNRVPFAPCPGNAGVMIILVPRDARVYAQLWCFWPIVGGFTYPLSRPGFWVCLQCVYSVFICRNSMYLGARIALILGFGFLFQGHGPSPVFPIFDFDCMCLFVKFYTSAFMLKYGLYVGVRAYLRSEM